MHINVFSKTIGSEVASETACDAVLSGRGEGGRATCQQGLPAACCLMTAALERRVGAEQQPPV